MRIRLLDSRFGLLNSTTRLPFRYAGTCLTKCPQGVLRVLIEASGKCQAGYSGDCLPPGWFDKSPEKDYAAQISDMLAMIDQARAVFAGQLETATDFFPAWQASHGQMQAHSLKVNLPRLLASFASSLVERALLDAMCRVQNTSFSRAVRSNLFGIPPAEIYPELAGLQPSDWLPAEPLRQISVRHTVGLTDPLWTDEIRPHERLDDGYPQSLEQYLQTTGIRYFKIKVANRLEPDLERLVAIAQLVEQHRRDDYFVTLDGNEQYTSPGEFVELVDRIVSTMSLQTLWRNTLLIEQPLQRRVALSSAHAAGIRSLCKYKPTIIDESDEYSTALADALELGYRGVSTKSCKGAIRGLLNAGLLWHRNRHDPTSSFVISGEDLCSVGIVPVQADLCLAANLGITHVERNGHHYHRGLSYLPCAQQEAALDAHGDFYRRYNDVIRPHVRDGQFHVDSLDCVGFGFAVEPDLSQMTPAGDWSFDSLGL